MKAAATVLMVSVLALTAVGMVVLYSVGPTSDPLRYVSRQLIALAAGLLAAGVISLLGPKHFKAASPWLLAVAVLMLVLVLVPGIGYKANGARRWFRLSGFQFQPSDFAKLAMVVFLAHYGAHYQRLMRSFVTGIAVPGGVILLFMGLVFLEPDWGTALLIGGVSIVMMLVAGARAGYILLPGLLAATAVGFFLWKDPVRSDRVYSWLHLEETKDGVGYQAYQARIALGSGGLAGKGLDHSTQKRLLPEHQTDFIFAIIGEEFGYAGSVAMISAFLLLFASGVYIAWRAPDSFTMLLATGVSFLIALQALLNIAVVSGALPNKGISLPFVSYGGSSLMMMLSCVGILISVARAAGGHREGGAEAADLANVPVTRLA